MPKYVVEKTVTFEAAHQLDKLPAEHKCSRLHGHTYRVDVRLVCGSLDQNGMVIDFDVVKAFIMQYDHQNLNDFVKPSTAECLARDIWDGLDHSVFAQLNRGVIKIEDQVRLLCVTVYETPQNKVEFFGGA